MDVPERLRAASISTICDDRPAEAGHYVRVRGWARLRQVLDIGQPHVVHVHNLLNPSFDLWAAAHTRGIPVVTTLHDFTLVCPPEDNGCRGG